MKDQIPTHCPVYRPSIGSLITDTAELHGCAVDDPGHFFAQVEGESVSSIPPTLPISAIDTCYNGGIKDGCGARIEFIDGVALCPRCKVHHDTSRPALSLSNRSSVAEMFIASRLKPERGDDGDDRHSTKVVKSY